MIVCDYGFMSTGELVESDPTELTDESDEAVKNKTTVCMLVMKDMSTQSYFATMVDAKGPVVGTVNWASEWLRHLGHRKIVFMSDNGGHPEYTANRLRGSKWNLYEGGIRVPMITRWPGRSEPGGKRYHPVIGYDLFATFAAAAQRPVEETDGMDLLPVINRPGRDFPRPLFWHFPFYHPEGEKFGRAKPDIGINDFVTSQTRPHSAIRYGRYKLIYFDEDQRAELYKVRGGNETLELSDQAKEMKQHLLTILMKHLNSVNARRAEAR